MSEKIATRRINSSFLVGLFVIFGSLIIAGIIIWLGAVQFFRENIFYSTYFDGSVGGLETGSPVKYQGVPIGSVHAVRVAEDNRLIEVIMQIDIGLQINDSMRVKSEMSGIAGGKFLQIFYPDTTDIFVDTYPRLSFKPKYPVIKSSPSGFEEIETAAKEVMNNFRTLQVSEISRETVTFLRQTTSFLESATAFFDNPKLYNIIDNLEQTSSNLQNILARADTSNIIANLQRTSVSLMQTAQGLEQFSIEINRQIEGMDLPDHVKEAFARYDSLMLNTQQVINSLAFRTETVMFNLNGTMQEAKSATKQLKKSLREISDNPAQVFFSDPPPPEK